MRNTGIFQPIPKQNMISLPTRGSEIIFRDWKALGAQYVVVGNIEPSGGKLQVRYEVRHREGNGLAEKTVGRIAKQPRSRIRSGFDEHVSDSKDSLHTIAPERRHMNP